MPEIIHSSEDAKIMPLLEKFCAQCEGIDLSNVTFFCAQHIVWSTYSLFYYLTKLGARPSNFFVIGKCYSTNIKTYRFLLNKGFNVEKSSLNFDSNIPYDIEYKKNVELFADKIKKLSSAEIKKTIVILDDGGHLISEFSNIKLPFDKIVAIEQTSAGFHFLKKMKTPFPVINVARSYLKKNYEVRYLIDLMISRLEYQIDQEKLDPKSALILGNGVIGKNIARKISSKYSVKIFDSNAGKTGVKNFDFKRDLQNFDIILGCTGYTSVPRELHQHIKSPCILVSMSSSDREFDASYLRKMSPRLHTREYSCHENINNNGLVLLNNGFPLPFDGHYSNIDTKEFQLTRTLLLAGVVQGIVKKNRKGLNSFSKEYEKIILNDWHQLL